MRFTDSNKYYTRVTIGTQTHTYPYFGFKRRRDAEAYAAQWNALSDCHAEVFKL